MLSHLPFDENIFIDADTLVYGDITSFFSYFPMKGVKHFGKAYPVDTKGKGWFDAEDIGKWGEKIHFCIYSYGGIIFASNDECTKQIYDTSIEILTHYFDYSFREFPKPSDEPIMALAMSIHNNPPIEENWLGTKCFYRVEKALSEVNVNKGLLAYSSKWNGKKYFNVLLLHIGTAETKQWLYKSEILRLKGNKWYWFYKKTIR